MKRFFCILFVICYMFPVVSSATENKWKQIDRNTFINLSTIINLDERYGYSFILKSYNKGQYEPVYGKQISYTIKQTMIDCESKKYKVGHIDSYDAEDRFVNGDYNRYANFQSIVPETPVSVVAKVLCRVEKK